ncbi:MAG TPA: DUF1501 domain-containing protein [Gemmataceae bacterium]|nr:DUF1501 domain-containing protein [Gemmataceae bacterium]
MPALLARRASAAPTSRPSADGFGRAKSCILLFMGGGPSQLATFDLKPDAPAEVRGDFRPIPTDVPGIRISDHLPLLAKQAHKYAVIRSVTDDYVGGAHGQSVYLALTGHHSPRVTGDDVRPSPEDYPCLGSVVSRFRPNSGEVPPFVWLLDMYRHTFAGEGGGLLGKRFDPFRVLQDPSRPDFEVQALRPPTDIPLDRLAQRRDLLDRMSRQGEKQLALPAAREMGAHYEQVFNLMSSPRFHKAFDLRAEPERLRERYGKTKFGQGTLLARRLVEHGVPLVTVFWNGPDPSNWDTHYEETKHLKVLLPPTDRAFSALLDDLQTRGLLDETLVVWMGEFGRAPRIEDKGGRGHWGRCYSVVFAGGGVKGGQVLGKSDRFAAYPAANPVSPADLVATIYHALGIDSDIQVTDHTGRPVGLCLGSAVHPLFR